MEEEIIVWKIALSNFESKEAHFFSLLNEAEQKRAKAFVTDELTRKYTLSQGILRSILASYLEISPDQVVYTFGHHRKPYLAENHTKIQFNLTHSGDYALVAICYEDEVGVDIEKLNPAILDKQMEKTVFTDNELKYFYSLPLESRTEAFFSGWTHKEALLKLEGVGLYKELRELDVPLRPLDETEEVLFEEQKRYLQSFKIGSEYLGAVASPKSNFILEIKEYLG